VILDAPEVRAPRSEKIGPSHLERLAVVYVRQSTAQQVLDHAESTRLQYGLAARARALGWPQGRVLVIDDDLGKSGASAQDRMGFQRLVSEVSLNHVGVVLGVEMSRLARSSKDWHQLLEICALFSTLISDLDGVYNPANYNDRLLLGLKGTMSEAELHVLKQRMHGGKLSKARRGELAFLVPTGYVRRPSGEVVFDPDEEVQQVVALVFRKFEELGTLNALLRYLVRNRVKLGVRAREGEAKGELEWRVPNRMTLQNMLKNPVYAGAYAYGRRRVDPRRKKPGRPGTGYVTRPTPSEEWHVLIKDRLPAYISWERYERNTRRLAENRARTNAMGAPRAGASLLQGLLVCGRCGRRMTVRYDKQGRHVYLCERLKSDYGGQSCQRVSGPPLDGFVVRGVLGALEPAALELSLAAAEHLEKEREELDSLWQKRLERAAYEADRAGRHYRLLEPENRLVARQLAKNWEEKLAAQQGLQEDYDRFLCERPKALSGSERKAIRRLSEDIPALWEAPTTTNGDRKGIVRQVVERVVVEVRGVSERVGWAFAGPAAPRQRGRDPPGGQAGAAELLPRALRARPRFGGGGFVRRSHRRAPQRGGLPPAQVPGEVWAAGSRRPHAPPGSGGWRALPAGAARRTAKRERVVVARISWGAGNAEGNALQLDPARLGAGPPTTGAPPTVGRMGGRC
jgi:DNA invertase Pin-like site-specific DNA recombinase